MPKDTKTLGNNKARACESLGFVHKKRLCQRFDTTSLSKSIDTRRLQSAKINPFKYQRRDTPGGVQARVVSCCNQ